LKIKKGDTLILFFILIALMGWLLQNYIWPDSEQKTAIIEIDGQTYQKIAINTDTQEEFIIELPKNNQIHIVVEKNSIQVEDASCPDKVCIRTGAVSKPGQNIVCLPNKVVVYIAGAGDSTIDDLSF